MEKEILLPSGETLWISVDATGNQGGGLPGVEISVHCGPESKQETRLPTKAEFDLAVTKIREALPD